MSTGVIFILGKGVTPILAYGVKSTWPQGSSAPGFSTSDEKSKITAAIAYANGNLTKAASLLGISHRTLWEKRKKYGLA